MCWFLPKWRMPQLFLAKINFFNWNFASETVESMSEMWLKTNCILCGVGRNSNDTLTHLWVKCCIWNTFWTRFSNIYTDPMDIWNYVWYRHLGNKHRHLLCQQALQWLHMSFCGPNSMSFTNILKIINFEFNSRAVTNRFWTIWWVSQAVRLTPISHTRQDSICFRWNTNLITKQRNR